MARRFFSPSSLPDEEPLINLTPLIDVVFVILIAFILIAPLLEYDTIALASGRSHPIEGALSENLPLTIAINADNTILWNREPVTFPELLVRLRRARMENPSATPLLFPDRHAHFQSYQAVKNAVEEAGFSQLDVVLKTG